MEERNSLWRTFQKTSYKAASFVAFEIEERKQYIGILSNPDKMEKNKKNIENHIYRYCFIKRYKK